MLSFPATLLRLQPDFEEFLSTLGKHTRRNIRACLRKTEQAGIEFAGILSKEEYMRAVERLNFETDFPAEPRRLARDERLLELHDGERIGLRAADGDHYRGAVRLSQRWPVSSDDAVERRSLRAPESLVGAARLYDEVPD